MTTLPEGTLIPITLDEYGLRIHWGQAKEPTMPNETRFSAALTSAKASLARAREQEGALLRELHDEIKEIHGVLSNKRYRNCPIPFNVVLDDDPEDCEPYLSISIEPYGERHQGELEIVIGPREAEPYQFTIRRIGLSVVEPPACGLDEAIQIIAEWVAENTEEIPSS